MRNKILIYSCAFLALSLYSCSSEEETQEGAGNIDNKDLPAVVLTAGFGDGSVARFMINAQSPYSCVYPTKLATSYSSGTFVVEIPTEQKHSADKLFGTEENVSIAYNDKEDLYFQNTCGILSMTLIQSAAYNLFNVTKIRLNTPNSKISGEFKVTPKNGPALTAQSAAKTYKDITLATPTNFANGAKIKLNFVVPPIDHNGRVTVEMYDNVGAKVGEWRSADNATPLSLARKSQT